MVIAPIKELKDGAAISAKCHELDEPIHITKNGYGDMVIMSTEVFARYDRLIRTGMAEYRAGKSRDAFEALAELREKHGL